MIAGRACSPAVGAVDWPVGVVGSSPGFVCGGVLVWYNGTGRVRVRVRV